MTNRRYNVKVIFEQVISRGNYDLTGLLKNIDRYHIEGKLTDDDRDTLYAMARQEAVPQYDAAAEIEALWTAIHAVQDEVAALKASGGEEAPDTPENDEWPEWEQRQGAHDAYRVGDKVSYKGKHYICVLLTTYAPDVYPAAWEEVPDSTESTTDPEVSGETVTE